MAKQINARVITKHDSATNWAKAVNFIPKEGELIVYEPELISGGVTSVARIKVGDGVSKIDQLKFITAPYVEKKNGYTLSKNDFTDKYKNILDEMSAIENIKFTDTTYVAVQNGGLFFQKNPNDEFKYNCYNTGLLSVEYDNNAGELIFGKYDTQEVPKINLKEIIGSNLENFISTGKTDGTLRVGDSDIAVYGLGELAFLNESDINEWITNATGDKEVYIGNLEGRNGEKLWIDTTNGENLPFIKYRISGTNTYYTYPFLRIDYDSTIAPWRISFSNETGNYEINTGIFSNSIDITEGADLNNFVNIGVFRLSEPSFLSSIKNSPTINSCFKLIVIEGHDSITKLQMLFATISNDIYYRVYNYIDDNTYIWTDWINLALPDNYLKLTGGTVTGTTVFSDTTESTSTTTGAVKITGGLGVEKNIYGDKVYGAVWNDYAEYRSVNIEKPGICVTDTKDGTMNITHERLMPCCKIITDTFGFAIGKTEEAKVPVAVSGRVLAYTYEDRKSFEIGDCVCSGPNGFVSKMTREEIINYPDRIVGIVSEIPNYTNWGENNIAINDRIWIYVR